MPDYWKALCNQQCPDLRQRIIGLYLILILFNLAAWGCAFAAFHRFPLLLGTSLLAYAFGLRHAVDADHIAAIDNVTRKLMQAGQRPIGVGLMFSLGHSSIVMAASVGIAVTATALGHRFDDFKQIGTLIGTVVSTLFLFGIAVSNLLILRAVIQVFRRVRSGGRYIEQDLDGLIAGSGLLARVLRPLFRLIGKSWHMAFLGLLFGLGFDTATEVGLLGISAASATQGLPIWSILIFPALFTAGMTLIDTTDSILMLGAYGWAFAKPIRKLYYNITVTSISVGVALTVGSIEGLGLLSDTLGWKGGIWNGITTLNDHFGIIGYVIVGLFGMCWLCSALLYRFKRLDDLEIGSDSL